MQLSSSQAFNSSKVLNRDRSMKKRSDKPDLVTTTLVPSPGPMPECSDQMEQGDQLHICWNHQLSRRSLADEIVVAASLHA